LLAIRLTRRGAKKKPFYRIIVTEKRSKRDGRFVESIGYYDPCRNPADVKLDQERVNYWLERGAQPSDTVRSIIKRNAGAASSAAESTEAGA
jgi:small subunit ribosomal protein S16